MEALTVCDYDTDWHEISDRTVTTRKDHQCESCLRRIPVGTRCRYFTGKSEGEFCGGYACPACDWAAKQQDHSALHLCWGWAWSDDGELFDRVRHRYIASALAGGGAPTLLGIHAEVRCHLLADAGDDPEERAAAEAWTWPTAGAYA